MSKRNKKAPELPGLSFQFMCMNCSGTTYIYKSLILKIILFSNISFPHPALKPGIRYPASSIQYQVSSIQYQVSSIQYQVPSIPPLLVHHINTCLCSIKLTNFQLV